MFSSIYSKRKIFQSFEQYSVMTSSLPASVETIKKQREKNENIFFMRNVAAGNIAITGASS